MKIGRGNKITFGIHCKYSSSGATTHVWIIPSYSMLWFLNSWPWTPFLYSLPGQLHLLLVHSISTYIPVQVSSKCPAPNSRHKGRLFKEHLRIIPWASLVAYMVKNLPAMQETWIQSLGCEDLLEKGMATHSSTVTWRIPWTEELGGLQSMELWRVGHDLVANTHRAIHFCILNS